LCIEFNGLYWHSAERIDKNYHSDKTKACASKGYQLIHILESEWLLKRDIVKSILRAKLGVTERIWARNCTVSDISATEAKTFFEQNHIQGNATASRYIGCYHNGRLVTAISIGRSRFSKEAELELIRYATVLNVTVVGAFGKMLAFLRKTELREIVTYCDLRYSVGTTYAKFGKFVRETGPGYSWNNSTSESIPRYQTQKSKLEKLFPEHYSSELTEVEIMKRAGYFQNFDSGHAVYVLT